MCICQVIIDDNAEVKCYSSNKQRKLRFSRHKLVWLHYRKLLEQRVSFFQFIR